MPPAANTHLPSLPTGLSQPAPLTEQHQFIGAILYYARAVDNKLLATLSTLSSQQATATEATNAAMNQLLDYLTTYPDDDTTYRTSNMILCAHANAGFHNKSKGRS